MFNLSIRERFIILFLTATLLLGLSVIFYRKANSVVDVKIKAFDYAGELTDIKKININDAGQSALMSLPGVGKSLADNIVEYRSLAGNFISIEEIKKVKGIKDSLFDKIKDYITVE
ncbi:MAG: helix-hairpin-helix domain-containing protein [Candidatus Omnitrophota bacterium]|nr:helix-hairpin-helix domain-containing protein [Candidatus Omnitrophota bacterium]